ncbi:hypothetical protein BC936DRAFT_140250 [Jimgerdemannia flammicorona]|uniref:chitin deacetylase n=1 Tax=Jimgerdemannia flammicorona TaxID=994334 RepID=A0A433DH59_9FUNG|nr:hypothetical protein BC936DRAFT_140250 [Jimgerdemannia flammicorona]
MPSKITIASIIGLLVASTSAQTNTTYPVYPNNFNWQRTYPALFDSLGRWAVPPTNSSEVVAWYASINKTLIPPAPIIAVNATTSALIDPYAVGQNPYCDWSFDICSRPSDVRICPDKGVWGLTFDDGPTPDGSKLYDFLAQSNQKATLFYIGIMVAQYPSIAQKGCAAGHQIGVHTWSHHPLTTLTNEQIVAELMWTATIIKEVCGITPRYFRPPTGDFDDRVRFIAESLGFTPIIWDLDTNDWTIGTAGSQVTTATEDASFVKWIAGVSNDTTGHICLQHELNNITVNEAIKNLPALQKAYKVMPVASCTNEQHPYTENIIFPTINNAALQPNSLPINGSTTSSTSNITSASPSISAGGLSANSSSKNAAAPNASGSSALIAAFAAAFVCFVFSL